MLSESFFEVCSNSYISFFGFSGSEQNDPTLIIIIIIPIS